MLVKMITKACGPDFCYGAGQVVNVPDEVGKAWVNGGFAEALTPSPSPDSGRGEQEGEEARMEQPEKAVSRRGRKKAVKGEPKV